jgi:hypothetical protein
MSKRWPVQLRITITGAALVTSASTVVNSSSMHLELSTDVLKNGNSYASAHLSNSWIGMAILPTMMQTEFVTSTSGRIRQVLNDSDFSDLIK